jgi:hypothetical protein
MPAKQPLFAVRSPGFTMPLTVAASQLFINFDKPYPSQDFTVMIWDDDRPAFGNLDKYTGSQICAHGLIKEYRRKPEIVLRNPESLQAK